MKCVRYLDNDEVRRLNNDYARKLVREGKAVFVPKSVYKHGSGTILAVSEATSTRN